MIVCRACKIFHDPQLNCRIAANQLRAGTLPEPWLSANYRNSPTLGGVSPEVVATPSEAQKVSLHVNEPVVDRIEPVRNAQHETAWVARKISEKRGSGVGRPRVYNDPKERLKEYRRLYMQKYRAKMKEAQP